MKYLLLLSFLLLQSLQAGGRNSKSLYLESVLPHNKVAPVAQPEIVVFTKQEYISKLSMFADIKLVPLDNGTRDGFDKHVRIPYAAFQRMIEYMHCDAEFPNIAQLMKYGYGYCIVDDKKIYLWPQSGVPQ